MQQREPQPRRRTGSLRRRRLSAIVAIAVAWVCLGATPVLAQPASADPGLDTVMKTVPSGFTRVANDPIPTGPMTVEQFNELKARRCPSGKTTPFYGALRGPTSRLLFWECRLLSANASMAAGARGHPHRGALIRL